MTWYVHDEGRTFAASERHIRAMLAAGTLSTHALAWRAGEPDWQAAMALFPPAESVVVGARPFAAETAGKPKKRANWPARLAFIAAVIGYCILFLDSDIVKPLPWVQDEIAPRLITVIVMMGLLLLLSFILVIWRLRPSNGRVFPGFRLWNFTAAIGALLILTAHWANLVIETPRMIESIKLAMELNDFTIESDPDAHAVILTGDIGPGLFDQMEALEQKLGRIDRFEITSGGGVVDEAMNVAEFLKERKTVVVAREECASACTLIAFASPHSYAEEGTIYGFHSISDFVPSEREAALWSLEVLQQEFSDYLIANGVPWLIVKEGEKTPPDDMYEVDAERLFRAGALDGILARGEDPPPRK